MKRHFCISLLILLSGCSSSPGVKQPVPGSQGTESLVNEAFSSPGESAQKHYSRKEINGAGYAVSVVSALDFLARKGERVSSSDKPFLEKEMVLMLELESADVSKDFFESPQLALSKEESLQYLVGNISSDLTLLQGEKEFSPTGVSFERGPGTQNKIRVLFFFKDVSLDKTMRIKYFDRIFDSGMINFRINN